VDTLSASPTTDGCLQDKKARKLTKKRVCLHVSILTELLTDILTQLGTLLRSKRKLEELGNLIAESRRAH
jgi:hypothetical protein